MNRMWVYQSEAVIMEVVGVILAMAATAANAQELILEPMDEQEEGEYR